MYSNKYENLINTTFEEVILTLLKNGTKIDKKDLDENGFINDKDYLIDKIARVKAILLDSKDKTVEEIIDIICNNYYDKASLIVNKAMLAPGLSSSIMLSNGMGVTSYLGRINANNDSRKIDNKTYFDIASITKLFTILLIFKNYKENRLDIYERVNIINPEYINYCMKLVEMLRFEYDIQTVRIDEKDIDGKFTYNKENAIKILKEASNITQRFNYNDIPYIVASELIPNFENEFNKYFVQELQMNMTTFNPNSMNMTGNIIGKQNLVNDPKAQVMGGVSGHAGVFSTSSDLTRILNLMINMDSKFIDEMIKVRNPESKENRENKMGMVYIKHPLGLEASEVPLEAAYRSMAISGFTGTWALYDIKNGYTLNFLSNPLSNETGKKDKGYVYAMDPFKKEMVYTVFMLKIANEVLSKYNEDKLDNIMIKKYL